MVFLTMRALFHNSLKLHVPSRIPSIKFRKSGIDPAFPGAAPQVKTNGAESKQVAGGQTMVIHQEVPAKFHRKPLSEEEIEIINNGGVP